MKLRTRLVLSIGVLFILFFLIAYVIEVFLLHNRLNQSESKMTLQIENDIEAKRKDLEEFMGIVIADYQGQVDALLYRINEFDYLRSGFEPNERNLQTKTWLSSASVLLHYKWINYIQNTLEGEIGSVIVPSFQELYPIEYYTIDQELFWVILKDSQAKPYLALHLTLDDVSALAPGIEDVDIGKFAYLYFLFDWKTLQNFQGGKLLGVEGKNQQPKLREVILKKIINSQKYLATIDDQIKNLSPDELRIWIEKNFHQKVSLGGFKENVPLSVIKKGEKGVTDLVKQQFIRAFYKTRGRDSSIVWIWSLNIFLSTALFGTDPLSPDAPVGISAILEHENVGNALLSKGAFFEKPYFDDVKYQKENASSLKDSPIPSSIALIYNQETNELFLGNLLALNKDGKKGALTIGVNIENLLQQAALVSNQSVAVVHQNKVIRVFDVNGERLTHSSFETLPLDQMKKSVGTVVVDDKEYYFLHLLPFEFLDLHFYLFDVKANAFSFVTFIKNNLSELVVQLSWNMRIIAIIALISGMIALELISRRITRPIAALAKATFSISEGHYEEVKLPKVSKDRRDEITTLCNSFAEMIHGLKDREKVKGVLNKVVSKEIAEEILKGNISLGGEEKTATILFADIRDFTAMTENMDPHHVIELLNACMTKISFCVDKHEGVIDKYIGDEAMALFGAPITSTDNAKKSVLAALEMMDKIAEWNKERKVKKRPPIYIGIGISTGQIVAGNMGAENRLNYTVLGANVNLASRLCSVAKPNEILVSKKTLESEGVKEIVDFEKLETISLKGFTSPAEIYRIFKKTKKT